MDYSSILVNILFAAFASAQGNLGNPQTSCAQTDAQVYQGCFSDTPVDNGGYTWTLESEGPPRDYPGYTQDTDITLDLCLTGCRGHGFRYALIGGDPTTGQTCYCSLSPPASTQVQGSDPTNNQTLNACHLSPASTNGCTGNRNQYCGSATANDVYADPSFSDLTTAAAIANYDYLGCYQNFNPGISYVTATTDTSAQCLDFCAASRWPYSFFLQPDGNSQNCGCGTEIQSNFQLPESECPVCNATAST